MATTSELFARAADSVSQRITDLKDDQLTNPTPCTDWDLRALLNHIIGECAWIAAMLRGETMEQIGDRFSGDLVGSDARASWETVASDAIDAVASTPADAPVTLSSGASTAERYAREVAADLTVHSWDVARGAGVDDQLDPELIRLVMDVFGPMLKAGRDAGYFAAALQVPDDADEQTKMLAFLGRQA